MITTQTEIHQSGLDVVRLVSQATHHADLSLKARHRAENEIGQALGCLNDARQALEDLESLIGNLHA